MINVQTVMEKKGGIIHTANRWLLCYHPSQQRKGAPPTVSRSSRSTSSRRLGSCRSSHDLIPKPSGQRIQEAVVDGCTTGAGYRGVVLIWLPRSCGCLRGVVLDFLFWVYAPCCEERVIIMHAFTKKHPQQKETPQGRECVEAWIHSQTHSKT